MSEDTARYVTVEEMDSTVTGQNMRSGAFVLPITDSDPTGESRGVEDGTVKLWVSHGRLHMSIFSLELNGWSTLSEEHIGTIKMFYGLEDDIDAGWQLCDGTNGTPDLRDKFVLGGTFAEVGGTEDERATVIADHTMTDPGIATFASSDTVVINNPASGGTPQTVSLGIHTHAGLAGGSEASAHVVSTDHYPPFYRLAFIMKVT